MFANGLEERGSIPGRVIPKDKKMVVDTTLRNTHHYVVKIKGKVIQRPTLHLSVIAIKKGAFGSPPTKVANFTYLFFPTGPWDFVGKKFANVPGDQDQYLVDLYQRLKKWFLMYLRLTLKIVRYVSRVK